MAPARCCRSSKVAEAGPEAAVSESEVERESSGEGGWRISSQDSGKTGSKKACDTGGPEERSLTFRMNQFADPLPLTACGAVRMRGVEEP